MKSKIRIVILQHPQEPKEELNSTRIVLEHLPEAKLRVGLSWPNLKKAIQDPEAQNKDWGVLFLGSQKNQFPRSAQDRLLAVDKKGKELPDQKSRLSALKGIIILDGTWAQAKTLWWRNAWFLKLQRLILVPKQKSLYGELRKEPRRECVSTLESVAHSLFLLGEPESLRDQLLQSFESHLNQIREKKKASVRPQGQ